MKETRDMILQFGAKLARDDLILGEKIKNKDYFVWFFVYKNLILSCLVWAVLMDYWERDFLLCI